MPPQGSDSYINAEIVPVISILQKPASLLDFLHTTRFDYAENRSGNGKDFTFGNFCRERGTFNKKAAHRLLFWMIR